jgi:hypothetical protein
VSGEVENNGEKQKAKILPLRFSLARKTNFEDEPKGKLPRDSLENFLFTFDILVKVVK